MKKVAGRFRDLARHPEFRGWPLIGQYSLAEKIPFFAQVVKYRLRTGNGNEDYYSLIRRFGWCVVFGVTEENKVITLVQRKPGVNQANWELPPGGIGRMDPDATDAEILEKTRDIYLSETGYGDGK